MQYTLEMFDNNLLVFHLEGELTGASGEDLIDELQQLIERGHRQIIVDCMHIGYINSSGLAVLVRIHKRMAEAGGDVKVCGVKGVVGDLLQLMRFDRIFDVHDSMASACNAFLKPPKERED